MQWNNAWVGSDITGYWKQRLRYNGKELHSNSGLLDYGFRYYDSSIGRFTGVDPLAEAVPSMTPYRYGFNNPIRFIDPNGLLEDTYGVDNDGNISKIDDKKHYDKDGKEVDLLVKGNKANYNKKGEVTNAHTYVKQGILKQGLNKKILSTEKDGDITYTHIGVGDSESVGTNLFEFLADNTGVEWSIMQTEPRKGVTSTSIFSTHDHDKERASASLLFSKDNPDLIKKLNYHDHSHPPTNKMGDTSKLRPSDADRDFAKRVRTSGSSAVLRVYFNGQYSQGY
jgi:RHS repeat-associated protein